MVFFWFRRDLRWQDNHGFYRALRSKEPVQPVFIFDDHILTSLPERDARVEFIYEALQELNSKFKEFGSEVWIQKGKPEEIWKTWIREYSPSAIYCNHDYEPYALLRDEKVGKLARENKVEFRSFKDQVIFEKSEVVSDQGNPYKVFTPYSKKWKQLLRKQGITSYPSETHLESLRKSKKFLNPSLKSLGFQTTGVSFPARRLLRQKLKSYAQTRDIPARQGTSLMGVHLRFGTLSPRKAVQVALETSDVWLNELIWREFFMALLFHFPQTVDRCFRPEYDRICWRNDESEFERWKAGQTGFPLVDAGMRELAETGYMHNRVRMLAASFLCKHLLIDWKWGERWFAKKLLDFELASNVGNWQWAAGCGADAAPYFRIFNPETQLKKFDPQGDYIRRWVPEWKSKEYAKPMVDHQQARERALRVYASAVKGASK